MSFGYITMRVGRVLFFPWELSLLLSVGSMTWVEMGGEEIYLGWSCSGFSFRLWVFCWGLSVVGCQLWVFCCRLSVVCCRLSVVGCCLFSVVCCALLLPFDFAQDRLLRVTVVWVLGY